jgi:hypothetical protein
MRQKEAKLKLKQFKKLNFKPNVVSKTCNSSPWETEAGRF